ncbi:deoxyribonuclease IV [Candidatus Ruminimicrobium bovinum]|uniref:deoxyribonuclease IV n=1 Tax=Candidatus Ruminimicrobium bovinum TaxID=3242779 RepID=UPI0039B95345
MLNIGCHLSIADGFEAIIKQALSIGANTFQFFTRNPRGFKAKDIDKQDIKNYLKIAKENNFTTVLAHAPYTLNPCSADEAIRVLAKNIFIDDLRRMEFIPGNMYNFHPGSHVGQGVKTGIQFITNLLNEILKPEQTTTVLLETMAGKGSEIGSKFEELKTIIDEINLKDKIGVCFDTCHVYDAGYDIVNDLDGVLEQFDKQIGLKNLKAVHLNDSMNPFASHKDRHQKIGQGSIGIKTFEQIINNKYLSNLPFYLETPNEIEGYAKEISILKNLFTS